MRLLAFLGPIAALLLAAPASAQVQAQLLPRTDNKVLPQRPALAQDFAPTPAIWRIADDDTTIYLFGTIHSLHPALRWRSPELNRIIAEADELAVESSDADFEKMTDRLPSWFAEDMTEKRPRPPFLERFPMEQRAAIGAVMRKAGMDAATFNVMPTWMGAIYLAAKGNPGNDADYVSDDEAGADATLERAFLAARKPVVSVEEPITLVDVFRGLSAPTLGRMITSTELGGGGGLAEELAWARGDLAPMLDGLTERELGPELYAILLTNRNRAWTAWLRKRLAKPGVMLFAVGVGHLVGPDSVQRMLADAGIVATRLPAAPARK